MMLPTFALLISLHTQDPLDQKISLDLPPAQAKKIIPELGKKIGIQLEAGESVANDVLILCFREMTGRQVMDALAKRVLGEWKPMDGKQFLSRSPSKVAERKKQVVEMLYKRYMEAVKKRVAAATEPMTKESTTVIADRMMDIDAKMKANPERFDSKLYEERSKLQEQGPGNRFTARILDRIDWRIVANLEQHGRVVFSTNPTSMQNRFLKPIDDLWSKTQAEHELWVTTLGEAKLKRGTTEEESPYFGYSSWDHKFESEPTSIMVVVEDARWGEYPTVELRVYDQTGNLMVSDGTSLEGEDSFPRAQGQDQEPDTTKVVLEIGPSYKPLFDEFVAVMEKAMNSAQFEFEFSEGIKKIAQKPEEDEPLDLFSVGIFNEYARKRNVNLITRLPDQTFALPLMLLQTGKEITAARLEGMMKPYWNYDKESNVGWLEGTPGKDRDNVNANRSGMGKFIRSVVAKDGFVSLKDNYERALSELKIRSDQPISMMLLFLFLGADAQQLSMGFERGGPYELLFWGSLQGSQWSTLTAGKPIVYGSLTPIQRGYADKIVFGTTPRVMVTSDLNSEAIISQQIEDNGMLYPVSSSEIRAEPTYSLSHGIPPDSQITLKVNNNTVLFPVQKEGPRTFSMGTSINQIAFMLFAKSRPDLFRDSYYSEGQFDSFRTASRTTYVIKMQLAKDIVSVFSLNETQPMSKESKTLDQLPEDIRTSIKKRIAELSEQYKNAKPGDFSPGAPPPVKP